MGRKCKFQVPIQRTISLLFSYQENTDAIVTAKDTLAFDTLDNLAQGATTLASITANVAGDGPLSKTLDMEGRQAAVDMIGQMAEGFKDQTTNDPAKLETFITGVTSSVAAIMGVS